MSANGFSKKKYDLDLTDHQAIPIRFYLLVPSDRPQEHALEIRICF